ncbi:MAG: membrane protein insertase YidC [Polyangiaceae bacterium]|nr:membrane protein insertase YidC [Polyangiaceae bacterium]
MERGSILKWVFIGLAIMLFMQFGWPAIFGSSSTEVQPIGIAPVAPETRAPEEICSINAEGSLFVAELSTRGASLRHVALTEPKYSWKADDKSLKEAPAKFRMEANPMKTPAGSGDRVPIDLVTTTREEVMPLRTDFRSPDAQNQQVEFNDFDWKLAASDGKSCTFTFTNETTSLTKTIAATGKPYELSVELKVENLANEPKKHRLTVEQTSWRTKKETEGSLGLISENMTEVMAATTQKTERHLPDAFEPKDFAAPEFTTDKWLRAAGEAKFAATMSSYFAKVAIPIEGPAKPYAETLIEEQWDKSRFADKSKDPFHGHIYRSRLSYPEQELQPKASLEYKVLAYAGPKERDKLAPLGITEVINLGWFAVIAKLLVSYLYVLKGIVTSWGWAIVLLTITVRTLLFPLSLSQIKNSAAMRRLKPEMDALNEKYKDDAAQRGLAMQELWRKNGVANPVVGCLPLLLQMPVWFALYTALQTAVELYHTPFGPFPDLSAPDRFFVIPIVLGASSFVQQKLMPPQGDPAQQKMMLYLMPGIFTVMMLFLPVGLGVYMLTNTWLGIVQQVLVERYLNSRQGAGPTGIEVREKTTGDGDKPAPALGKGKARARG